MPTRLPYGKNPGPLVATADGSVLSGPSGALTPLLNRLLPDLSFDVDFTDRAKPQSEMVSSASEGFDSLNETNGGDLVTSSTVWWPRLTWGVRLDRFGANGARRASFGDNGSTVVPTRLYRSDRFIASGRSGGVRIVGSVSSPARSVVIDVTRAGKRRVRTLQRFGRMGVGAIHTLRDGSVLVAGEVMSKTQGRDNWSGFKTGFRLGKFRPNGRPDRRFGDNGFRNLFFPRDAVAEAITVDRSGRVIVAGGSCSILTTCFAENGVSQEVSFARYLPGGALDRSFGNSGRITHVFGRRGTAVDLSVLGDGRILARVPSDCGNNCFPLDKLIALRPNGSIDRSFGRNGRLNLRLGRNFEITNMFPVGRHGVDLASTLEACRANPEFAVVRLDRRGALDRSFGGRDGVIDTGIPGGLGAYAVDAIRQRRGTVTFAGLIERRSSLGGAEVAAGLARVNLGTGDGRTDLRPCSSR